MIGRKYLRIGEAAELLGVSTARVRMWTKSGKLTSCRLGTGGHRRIPATALAAFLPKQSHRMHLPPEQLQSEPVYSVDDAADYLGVTARFLWNSGLLASQRGMLTGADIQALEQVLYTDTHQATWPTAYDAGEKQGGKRMNRGIGGPFGGGWEMIWDLLGGAPFGGIWNAGDARYSELGLRSLKRHLEAARANLDDRIQWIEEQLRQMEENSEAGSSSPQHSGE